MVKFTRHDVNSAPAGAKERLQAAQEKVGFIPNLYTVLADSPIVLEAYQTLGGLLEKATALDLTDRHIIMLVASYENGCEYCVAAHSGIAKMQKVADDVVTALRNGTKIANPKYEALRQFVAKVIRERGWVSDADTEAFIKAGYSTTAVLEILVGLAMKTISNYANHFAKTPLDAAFAPMAWTRPKAAAE